MSQRISNPSTRRFPRVQSERPILVRLLGEQRQYEKLAKTRVIGLGGLMYVGAEQVGYGSVMEVFISLREGVVRTNGRVVYEIPSTRGGYEIGVEFLSVSPSDRARVAGLVARGGA